MRLLHIISEMDPKKGGVGQAVRTMMTGLNEAGLQNEAVSLDSNEAEFLTANVLKIHALGPCSGPWSFSSKLMPWLLKELDSYDAVIVHGLWLYHSYAVRKAFRALKKKEVKKKGFVPRLFVMPHGMLDPYFQKSAGRRLKAIRNWFYWKLIEEKLINQSDGLFFTSQEEQRLAREPFKPYHPKRELVIGLGIEKPPKYNSSMKIAFGERCAEVKGQPYILYLGRIDEKKGVDLLIEAYGKLLKTTGELEGSSSQSSEKTIRKKEMYQPMLVIAGPGMDTGYGQRIQQLAANVNTNIFFPGMLVADAKWGAFYGCEAFILPSHQENFGIAVVEAMACLKPVLISNQVNIWKEIKTAGAGLVEDDTTEGTFNLLNNWNNLLENERQTMGQNASNCFKDFFSIGPVALRIKNAIAGYEVDQHA